MAKFGTENTRNLFRSFQLPTGLCHETPIVVLLFVLATTIGMAYVQSLPALGFFYQSRFGPAISVAMGEGYQDVAGPPSVLSFLNSRKGELPPEEMQDVTFKPPNRFHTNHYFLISSVGLIWRQFGVSWEALSPLFGLMYAVSICSTYGIFRLAAPRLVALPGTALLLLSPAHLSMLDLLRDYAKAPILLLGMFLLGLLIRVRFRRGGLVSVAILLGLLVGLGRGFRVDALLILPAFFLVLFLFTPYGIKHNLGNKGLAVVAFIMTVWLASLSYPASAETDSEGATTHVVAIGLAANLYPQLGIVPSLYEHGYKLDSDQVVWSTIADYNNRRGTISDVAYKAPGSQKAGANYLLAIARHFPADLLIRAYASVGTIFQELTFGEFDEHHNVSRFVGNPFLVWLYELRLKLANWFRLIGILWLLAALVALGVANVRWMIGFFVLFTYFTGTAILQFHFRHFFHLEVLVWLCVVIVLAALLHLGRRFLNSPETAHEISPRRIATVTAAVVFAVATGWALLHVTRVYQQTHLANLFAEGYLQLPLVPLLTEKVELDEPNRVLLRFPELAPEEIPTEREAVWSRPQYLVMELEHPVDAPKRTVAFVARYADKGPKNLDREFTLRLPRTDDPSTTRLYLPVHYFSMAPGNTDRFLGIESDAATAPLLTSVYRAEDLGEVPFLMTLALPHNWRRWPLYERLAEWERPRLWLGVGNKSVPFNFPERRYHPPYY